MNPVNLGAYAQVNSETYTANVDLPFGTQLICISFQADPSLVTSTTDKVDSEVQVLPPGCTAPDVFDFGNITPRSPRFVVEGTVLASDVATGTSGIGTGDMLEPDMSDDFGQVILVNGTLIFDLDEPYFFPLSSDILMGSDASIIVQEANSLFLFEQTRIVGCTEMWDRIEVQDGGILFVDGKPSGTQHPGTVLIRDGENGIQLNDGATILTADANYFNNWRSFTTTTDSYQKHFDFLIDGNNTVTSDGGLLPPHAGRLPLAGMDFYGLNGVNIIGSAGNTIEFSNLARGVRLTWSTATLEKLLFHDILDDPATSSNINSTEGTAVYARSTGQYRTLTYRGFGNSTHDIIDCVNGIRVDDMALDASGLRINRVDGGVDVRRSDSRVIDIRDCNITARTHGVNLFHNMPTTLDLTENIINIDDDLNTGNSGDGIGIRGEENATSSYRPYRITDNLVNVDNAETGIWFQSGLLPLIGQNTVDLQDPAREGYFGIDLQGSVYPNAKCNLVTGNGSPTDWLSAIAFTGTGLTNAFVRCNDVQDSDVGFRFVEMNDNTIFAGNEIGEHHLGLHIIGGESALIGPQVHNGNLWNGASVYGSSFPGLNGNFGARIDGGDFFNSRFEVDESEMQEFNTSTNVSGWFDNQSDPADSYLCNVQNTCPNGIGSNLVAETPNSINSVDYEIAAGNLTDSLCATAVNWTAQRRLYRRLLSNPSLYAGNATLQAFVDTAAQNSVGGFHAIEAGIAGLYGTDTVTASQLAGQAATIGTDLGAIYTIDSTLLQGGLTQQQEATLQSERDSLLADLKLVQYANDTLWASIESSRTTQAQQLKTDNAAITASGKHEENEQAVNEIFLETMAVGVDTFTSQQVTDLYSIASECPTCGGDAVFRARSLYALHDASVRFVNPSPCTVSRSATSGSMTITAGFAIYPNPATDQVTIELAQSDLDAGLELVVQSVTGSVLLRQALSDASRQVVNTSSLQAGAYIFAVFKDGQRLHVEQVFIVK